VLFFGLDFQEGEMQEAPLLAIRNGASFQILQEEFIFLQKNLSGN
jgi:hypothetical protein